jgi:hypothetical protein
LGGLNLCAGLDKRICINHQPPADLLQMTGHADTSCTCLDSSISVRTTPSTTVKAASVGNIDNRRITFTRHSPIVMCQHTHIIERLLTIEDRAAPDGQQGMLSEVRLRACPPTKHAMNRHQTHLNSSSQSKDTSWQYMRSLYKGMQGVTLRPTGGMSLR